MNRAKRIGIFSIMVFLLEYIICCLFYVFQSKPSASFTEFMIVNTIIFFEYALLMLWWIEKKPKSKEAELKKSEEADFKGKVSIQLNVNEVEEVQIALVQLRDYYKIKLLESTSEYYDEYYKTLVQDTDELRMKINGQAVQQALKDSQAISLGDVLGDVAKESS